MLMLLTCAIAGSVTDSGGHRADAVADTNSRTLLFQRNGITKPVMPVRVGLAAAMLTVMISPKYTGL
jgi:hypothetical protein